VKYERETVGHIINELAEMQNHLTSSNLHGIRSIKNRNILLKDIEFRCMQKRLEKLNECFINFCADPEKNINRLVAVCGELMGATCALYNRLEGSLLCSAGNWNVPADYRSRDKAKGHICYDVIQLAKDRPILIRNLPKTIYGQTDPNVKKYGLKTYIGQVVKLGDRVIGSLCAVYQKDFIPDNGDEWLMGVISSAIAVEERRRKTETELRKSEEEFRLTFENAKDAIFWANPETGIIIRCNKAAEILLEKTRNDIIGVSQAALHPSEKSKCYIKMFKKHIKQKGALDEEAEVITGAGKIKPVHITASVTSVAGRPIVQGIFRDISERKQQEEELRLLNRELVKSNRKLKRLVLKDPHTGLYNHRYFEEVIESEFYRAKRHTHSLSLVMLDIDYFKSVNEVYGHKFGDLVLKQFAKKLRKLARLHDHVIRFGDEEFVVILPGSDSAGALRMAQRISCATKIFDFGDLKNKVKINLSIAVVSYPEDGIYKSMDFIGLADKILHRAKECGGNRVCSSIDIKKEKLSVDEGDGAGIDLLKQKLTKLTKQVNRNLIESIFAFAKTIELKDHFTGEHVQKTVYYATEMATKLGLNRNDVLLIEQGAMLHDLGKIGISEKILLKKGKLTKEEFEKIKEHPKIGVDIIRPIQFLHGLVPLILYHHERWDGEGYLHGLKGEEIPIGARIIALADVYQALRVDRPYRKAFSEKKAIGVIRSGSGTQFDPHIVGVFLKILEARE